MMLWLVRPEAKCDYSLDVSGGWYDAGDHGKYVVNGGIALWTLMNLWERTKYLGSTKDNFGDGKLNIPEGWQSSVPDILDEARWEMEFILRMQVPEGKPMAGMVHHKIHDEEWTPLATPPDKDQKKRFLRPVSTAATLNLAATGAQAARIFREYDKAFADKCLAAAEKAWVAAKANPDKFAPPTDNHGGGPYDDNDVSDEQYWAASELYITTKKPEYFDELKKSPHYERRSARPLSPMSPARKRHRSTGEIRAPSARSPSPSFPYLGGRRDAQGRRHGGRRLRQDGGDPGLPAADAKERISLGQTRSCSTT